MENKINRFIKIYPWYSALTGDMLFYISINTLFLTLDKGLSSAQIVSLTTISSIVCLIIRFPILKVIHKIGNTISSRVSAFFLLLAAIIKTLAPNYTGILIGNLFYELYVVFHSVVVIALRNNLEIINKKEEFISLRTKGTTFYATITMLIAFVAGPIYNLHHYLPMLCAIVTCLIGFILSFFMADCSKYDKISKIKKVEKVKLEFTRFLIIAILGYGLFCAIVSTGQGECKLFIQETLLKGFNKDSAKVSFVLTSIVAISRVVRVVSNVIFLHLYRRTKDKVGVVLAGMLLLAVSTVLFGSFIPNMLTKIIIMALGYTIILFLRDPFKLYMQDIVFENTPKEQHQTLLTTLEVAVKLAKTSLNILFTLILFKYPLIAVIGVIFGFAVIELILSLRLYKNIIVKKAFKT